MYLVTESLRCCLSSNKNTRHLTDTKRVAANKSKSVILVVGKNENNTKTAIEIIIGKGVFKCTRLQNS